MQINTLLLSNRRSRFLREKPYYIEIMLLRYMLLSILVIRTNLIVLGTNYYGTHQVFPSGKFTCITLK